MGEDNMLISGEMVAHELEQYVVFQKIKEDSGMHLVSFRLWDGAVFGVRKECLYLTTTDRCEALAALPKGNTVLLIGAVSQETADSLSENLDLICVDGIDLWALVNLLSEIFLKYTQLEERLNRAIESECLQETIDTASELIGAPVNMLDMNHNTIVYCRTMAPVGDSMWDAIVAGYGYKHYSIVTRSIPLLAEMDTDNVNLYEGISNISGRYFRVYLLRKDGRGIATLGMHKLDDVESPFQRHTLQLADYVYHRLMRSLSQFPEIKRQRGKLFEQFIIDLMDGKTAPPQSAGDFGKYTDESTSFLLGVILFPNHIPQTDYYLTLMNYLEAGVPMCKCVIYQSRLYMLFTLQDGVDISSKQKWALHSFLEEHNCKCILSGVFRGLQQIRSHKDSLFHVEKYVLSRQPDRRIWYLYQLAYEYAMELLLDKLTWQSVCHPAIMQLIQYDRENESNFLETLQVYLKNERNITKTAQELHIHRNTLIYRINRIEDSILGTTLDNQELRDSLSFSFKCMDFSNDSHQTRSGKAGERTK